MSAYSTQDIFIPSFNHRQKRHSQFVAKRDDYFNKHMLCGSDSTRSFRGYKQQEQGEERGNVAKFCNCTSGGRAADRNWSSSPVGSYCRRKLMAKRSTLNGTKDGGESFNSGT